MQSIHRWKCTHITGYSNHSHHAKRFNHHFFLSLSFNFMKMITLLSLKQRYSHFTCMPWWLDRHQSQVLSVLLQTAHPSTVLLFSANASAILPIFAAMEHIISNIVSLERLFFDGYLECDDQGSLAHFCWEEPCMPSLTSSWLISSLANIGIGVSTPLYHPKQDCHQVWHWL